MLIKEVRLHHILQENFDPLEEGIFDRLRSAVNLPPSKEVLKEKFLELKALFERRLTFLLQSQAYFDDFSRGGFRKEVAEEQLEKTKKAVVDIRNNIEQLSHMGYVFTTKNEPFLANVYKACIDFMSMKHHILDPREWRNQLSVLNTALRNAIGDLDTKTK